MPLAARDHRQGGPPDSRSPCGRRTCKGKPFELAAEEYLARAICHEVDHLDGVLFTDHLRGLRKERVRRQLKRLASGAAAPPPSAEVRS